MKRRKFMTHTGMFAASFSVLPIAACKGKKSDKGEEKKDILVTDDELFFKISLAEWSLHKALFDGELSNLDFAKEARETYGVDGIEYVSAFIEKVEDKTYLDELNMRADDFHVEQLLIMVDREGGMASPDDKERQQAIENHYKWVEAAQYLGCHSIRVNCFGEGDAETVKAAGVDGLGRLAEFAKDFDINVIVENHGGYSSNGAWLADVMKQVNMPNCGTLPDFGNFCIKRDSGKEWDGSCIEEYDRYKGVEELMPYAKGVSAKSYHFDEDGNEKDMDYVRLLQIVKDAGYSGYIGIEYEGSKLSEHDGIMATKDLLIMAGKKVT